MTPYSNSVTRMQTPLRVGINGFGRIGRAIFRKNLSAKAFQVVAINDINPDIGNVVYQLNYDSIYGTLENKFGVAFGNRIVGQNLEIEYFNQDTIDAVPWDKSGVDVVIDATGVQQNVASARNVLDSQKVQFVFITHSPDEVDFTLVLGANEEKLSPQKHQLIASSICDATAIAPCLKLLDENLTINNGYVTTLHPWLSYQNLMDGPASSWSRPGEIYHHYALGRSMVGNMIPKPTSAIEATCKVLEKLTPKDIGSFSYRTPLPLVCSADITLNLKTKTTASDIQKLFLEAERSQKWNIFHNTTEPLVSSDFKQSEFSAVVDHRWTDVIGGTMLKLVIWYDNEWGYASRVVDQVQFVTTQGKSQ